MAHLHTTNRATGLDPLSGPTWPKRCEGDGMESHHSLLSETGSSAFTHNTYPAFDSKSCIPPLSLSGRASPQVCITQPLPSPSSRSITSTAGEFPLASSSSITSLTRPLNIAPAPNGRDRHPAVDSNPTELPLSSLRADPAVPAAAYSASSVLASTLPPMSTHSPSMLRRAEAPHRKKSSSSDTSEPMQLEHLRTGSSSDVSEDHSEQKWQTLLKEKSDLNHQLQVQKKRNGELKRLLVASIGADLQERFDGLCHEKAENAELLGVLQKEQQLQRERIEHLAIQCDVYQSKYRASSVMIEELSSLQTDLQSSLVESRGVIQQLLTEQRQVFGDLRFGYQQLSSACVRLQDAMNTTSTIPSLESAVGSGGRFDITTQQLSQHCCQLAAWCTKHLAALLQAIRGDPLSGIASAGNSFPLDLRHARSQSHHVSLPMPGTRSLDEVQWRPSNAEAFAHQAVTTRLPHSSKSRPAISPSPAGHRKSLGLSSTWTTLDYCAYQGCSQCKGQVQIV